MLVSIIAKFGWVDAPLFTLVKWITLKRITQFNFIDVCLLILEVDYKVAKKGLTANYHLIFDDQAWWIARWSKYCAREVKPHQVELLVFIFFMIFRLVICIFFLCFFVLFFIFFFFRNLQEKITNVSGAAATLRIKANKWTVNSDMWLLLLNFWTW